MMETVAQLESREQKKTFERVRSQLEEDRVYLWEVPSFTRAETIERLQKSGAPAEKLAISGVKFREYLEKALATGIYDNYQKHFAEYFTRKALEHFVSFELMSIGADDIYMDVASSGSVVPEILEALYGLKSPWRQDITYPEGVHGHKVGSNAAAIPLPDNSLTKIAMHCSFEHFEKDADTGFVREAARLLRPGGMVCILPLYMSDQYHIMSSLDLISKQRIPNFEAQTPIFWSPRPNNYHGRFYNVEALRGRVLDLATKTGLCPKVVDLSFIDSEIGMGTNLALLLEKE